MKADLQRVAIAGVMNWEVIDETGVITDSGLVTDILNDLNACAEFEKTLTWDESVSYRLLLAKNSDGRNAKYPTAEAAMCHATAQERCDGFCKLKGLWKD